MCRPGWHAILRALFHDLEELGWDGQCCQVKEKFGSLRFYIENGNAAIWNRIDRAEKESQHSTPVNNAASQAQSSGPVGGAACARNVGGVINLDRASQRKKGRSGILICGNVSRRRGACYFLDINRTKSTAPPARYGQYV
jgi:hypothetical protein